MTVLEAVDRILREAGHFGATALDSSGQSAATFAEKELDNQSRIVQGWGWHFNTERLKEITPNGSSQYELPAGTIRIDTSGASSDVNVAVRGDKLYDVENQTYTFSQASLVVDYVTLFEFCSVPEDIAQLIVARASVAYTEQCVDPRSTRLPSLRQKVLESQAQAFDSDRETGDGTVFDTPDADRMLGRLPHGTPNYGIPLRYGRVS